MMNFAIEAPAESNPLTSQTLHHVLQSATSSNQQQVQTAAKQLQNWEKSTGFYSLLQSLYTDYTLPVELRYLAVIQLKNGIDKYWRKTATNAIRAEEKSLIRSRLLRSALHEPDQRLALQISLLMAKIVRYEYPHDWPDAVSSIINSLRSERLASLESLYLSRTLLVLLYVVKELSTARLQRSRAKLQSVTPEIIEILSTIYIERVQSWLVPEIREENQMAVDMDQSLLALRVLRRLIIAGYDFPNRQPEMQDLWKAFTSQFGQMYSLTQSSDFYLNPRYQRLTEQHLVQIAKLHLDLAKSHPAGFALLPGSVDLAQAYWGLIRQCSEAYGSCTIVPSTTKIGTNGDADTERIPFIERLALKGLLILRACARMVFNPAQTFKYQRDEDKQEKRASKDMVRKDLLTEGFASEVMETLVTRFFVFTARDLKEWEEEPDEWEKSQEGGGEDWEFSIRTCSEKLFLDLMLNFKEILVRPLLAVFRNIADAQNADVMLKDSLYAAIGLAAPILYQYPEVNIERFLEDVLAQEAQIQEPGYNILRRRIAIFLGQWLPVKEGLNRPLVYQIFQHLLDKNDRLNDQVVRVTAARQLKNVIDPFEFAAEQFMPYVSTILSSLMKLTEEVELPETKITILSAIALIVNKMEVSITPFADQIMALLPPLWNQAGEEYLMKQTILGILSSLCESMQAESRNYHPAIVPLVQSSIDPSSETRVHLLEDALDLWSTILTQTPSDDVMPEVVGLVQYLIPLFEVASENLRKALEITELYIYLIPSQMLSNASSLLYPLVPILGSLNRNASGLITSLVELLIRTAHELGGVQVVYELTQILISSKLLSILLEGLNDACQARSTTGPHKIHAKLDVIVETDYLNILAQLAVISPDLLLSILENTTYQGQNEPRNTIDHRIGWLIVEWIDHVDTVSHPNQKKLNMLALTSLFGTGHAWILGHLQGFMSEWTSAVTEFVVDVSLDANVVDQRDSLVYNDIEALKIGDIEAPADQRRRLLTFKDPVHRIDIRDHIKNQLGMAVERCGGMEVFQIEYVGNVDKDVVNAFGALGVV